MPQSTRVSGYSVDDLLRSQEGPARKKRRLSDSDSERLLADSSDTDRVEGGQSRHVDSDSDSDTSGETDQQSFVVEDRLTSVRPSKTQTPPSVPTSKTRQTTFASLGISSPLQGALTGMSIKVPTEVQAACIPPLLAGKSQRGAKPYFFMNNSCWPGRDCIGNAKTGSGKTIAFAIPILQRLSIDPYGIFALVLTPTR